MSLKLHLLGSMAYSPSVLQNGLWDIPNAKVEKFWRISLYAVFTEMPQIQSSMYVCVVKFSQTEGSRQFRQNRAIKFRKSR